MKSRTIHWPNAAQSLEVIIFPDNRRLYLQNWKGLVFRVFANAKELSNCLKNLRSECLAEFEKEEELEEFLENYKYQNKASTEKIDEEKEAAKRTHYQFYLENCVDEEKGQIALSFENWVENHFEDSFLTCKLNGIQL